MPTGRDVSMTLVFGRDVAARLLVGSQFETAMVLSVQHGTRYLGTNETLAATG